MQLLSTALLALALAPAPRFNPGALIVADESQVAARRGTSHSAPRIAGASAARVPAPAMRGAGPEAGKDKALALMVLSSVPLAFGTFATAVQLAGALSDREAVLLQCGTYGVATAGVLAMRLAREKTLRVRRATRRAGCELGLWISIAATLQSLGLQRTTAARAGFLVRLSTVIVPVAEALHRGVLPSKRVVMASALSVVGVTLMTLAPGALSSNASPLASLWRGDALIALAACVYSVHILRLGVLAPRHDAWTMATAKAPTQLACSAAALACFRGPAARAPPLRTLAQVACFTGLVTCAFPMWAQGFGQSRVRPTTASLIYASAPVVNAAVAAAVLGQHLSVRACLGASFMMAGMGLAVFDSLGPSPRRSL